jgi:DNA-binding XRE family transcriptional regulator
MKFTSDFIAKAIAGSRKEAAELAPVIRKCAQAGAAKSGALVHADDIEQELWMFLMENKDRLDDEYNIEPFLIKTAMYKGMTHNRKFEFFGTEGSDEVREIGLANLAGKEVVTSEEAADALIEQTEQQTAMDYLLSQSSTLRAAIAQSENEVVDNRARSAANEVVGDGDRELQSADNDDGIEDEEMRKKPRQLKCFKELSPEAKELRRIREDARLSQVEMAARCGIKLSTYQAYEYGKTFNVNEEVLAIARKIKANPDHIKVEEQYARRSMRSIVTEWFDRLSMDVGSCTELGKIIGVDRSTISRWLDKQSTIFPSSDSLLTYETRVKQEVEYRKTRDRERAREEREFQHARSRIRSLTN